MILAHLGQWDLPDWLAITIFVAACGLSIAAGYLLGRHHE